MEKYITHFKLLSPSYTGIQNELKHKHKRKRNKEMSHLTYAYLGEIRQVTLRLQLCH